MSIHKQDKRIKQKAKAYLNKKKLDFINKKENQKRMTKNCN